MRCVMRLSLPPHAYLVPEHPVPPPGQKPDPSKPRVNNGISGDGRRSTPELGKKLFDMKVDYAVKQIKSLIG